MNIYSKIPYIFIILGIVLIGMLIFEFGLPETKAGLLPEYLRNDLDNEKLAFSGENALIPASSPSNPEPKVMREITVIATAYSSTVEETDDTPFITAAGTWVRDGIIANNYLPFGTKVRLPELYGNKIFIVEDRMNSRKGNYQIDIWFPSHKEAEIFGAKRTYIEVLES